MVFKAILFRKEVKKFRTHFRQLGQQVEFARNTSVNFTLLDKERLQYIVVLKPQKDVANLLESSLREGFLFFLGWNEKFKKVA